MFEHLTGNQITAFIFLIYAGIIFLFGDRDGEVFGNKKN